MRTLRFGEITVTRCLESEGPSFHPAYLFPDHDAAALDAEREWLEPRFLDAASGRLIMSLHSYVIRTPRHTILVDTCVGNDKRRPATPPWHKRRTPYLDNLRALGVGPEEVDFVLCTHLHVDHVGWNTRLENGRWVPTFPNARYLFHRDEYTHWEAEEARRGADGPTQGSFADSVLPVMEAGRAVLVDGDHEIDDMLRLEPSPGHSPGHVYLNLRSPAGSALFTGDVLHHPVQCAYPEWNSRFCHDPERARKTRRATVERAADSGLLILAAHFPDPVAGRIVPQGARWRFVPSV